MLSDSNGVSRLGKLAEQDRAALTRISRQLTRPAAQMGHPWEGGTTPADRPIILKDMLGQELTIPLELCSTFEVSLDS